MASEYIYLCPFVEVTHKEHHLNPCGQINKLTRLAIVQVCILCYSISLVEPKVSLLYAYFNCIGVSTIVLLLLHYMIQFTRCHLSMYPIGVACLNISLYMYIGFIKEHTNEAVFDEPTWLNLERKRMRRVMSGDIKLEKEQGPE